VNIRHVLMTADAVGGVWRYAMELGAGLVSRGIRVTVAAMGPLPSDAQCREAEHRRIGLVSRGYRLEWMTDPWDDVARAGEWLLSVEQLASPDAVHVNGYCHAALPWRTPPLVVAHSCVGSWWRAVKSEPAPAEWDHYRKEVTRGLAAAGLVIAPTTAMLRALEIEYGPRSNATVIPNAVGPSRAADSAMRKEMAILTAGRVWDEGKNIRALCSIADQTPWPVWVAGDAGGEWGERNLGGAEYLGRLTSEALDERYARASIYALPARYEPFGLSILEAARAGCALVLGDIPSLRENWNGAALFVPPDDGRALQQTLMRLIDGSTLREDLAERARRRGEQFSIDRMVDAYLEAYSALHNRISA
jgi:glycosyltransferase involved in cell wall biosynthesis